MSAKVFLGSAPTPHGKLKSCPHNMLRPRQGATFRVLSISTIRASSSRLRRPLAGPLGRGIASGPGYQRVQFNSKRSVAWAVLSCHGKSPCGKKVRPGCAARSVAGRLADFTQLLVAKVLMTTNPLRTRLPCGLQTFRLHCHFCVNRGFVAIKSECLNTSASKELRPPKTNCQRT
jgi:hypothetical protein